MDSLGHKAGLLLSLLLLLQIRNELQPNHHLLLRKHPQEPHSPQQLLLPRAKQPRTPRLTHRQIDTTLHGSHVPTHRILRNQQKTSKISRRNRQPRLELKQLSHHLQSELRTTKRRQLLRPHHEPHQRTQITLGKTSPRQSHQLSTL